MALSANSICNGGNGDTAFSDLNLISGVPITDLPTPSIEKLIAWTSKEIDSCNVDSAAVNELRYMLRSCQEELHGRNNATEEVIGACRGSSQAECKVSEEVDLNNATMHIGWPRKAEGKTNAAFSEELSSLKLVKSRRSGANARQLQNESCIPATKSCVPSKARPSVRCPKKDSQTLLNCKKDFGLTGSSSRISKRRAYASRCRSRNLTSDKVQHIVLSDDEDVDSLQALQDAAAYDYKKYKIYYPSRDDPECVELAYGDIKSLDPGSCLSSPIMNFYIQYIRRSPSSIAMQKDECFVFNTYFYRKLEEAINCEGDKTAAFLKLRRWWKGVDLFQKTYVFLPIYGQVHWSLAIICIPAKEDESGPIVLHLDSLQVHSSGHILQTVSKFLLQEWNYIKENNCIPDLPFSKNVWEALPWRIERETIMAGFGLHCFTRIHSEKTIKMLELHVEPKEILKVPQQTNAYDCGLFVLYFMQRFLEEAPERLSSKDLSMFGKKWFLPEEASSLRDKVRDALVLEFEKNMLSDTEVNDIGDI